MAVMATDQSSASNNETSTAANGSRSPTEGGFSPGWNQEAEQRTEARRQRVHITSEENRSRAASQPQVQQPVTEEVDDDDEERMLVSFY